MRVTRLGFCFLMLSLALFLVGVFLWAKQDKYLLTINLTKSLPGHFYLVAVGTPVNKGDIAAFRWTGGATYPEGSIFIKRVAGVAGDVVSFDGSAVYVNKTRIGAVKTKTLANVPLAPAKPGVIEQDFYFMATPSPDSLDSRYALSGNIFKDQIIGKAYEIF